jgi:signal transduction histidine kinase
MSAADVEPVSFLVVDDLDENLIALRALLARPGVRLLEARSGREALEILLLHADVALALVDVQMPDMDGFELAELMRGTEQTKNIPIIFVTAGSREPRRVFLGYDAGAVDFLFKPIDPFILQHKADVFTQLHRQKRELVRLSERLAEELRLNETFVAAVSHDLRSPLGAIIMAAELASAQPNGEQVRRLTDRIRSSGRRMNAMIEDLLDLARARLSGGIPIEPAPVDLAPQIRKIVNEHRLLAPARTIEVACEGGLTGFFDADRVEQVISNLLANAIRYGAVDVAIRVRADGSDTERVTIAVQNGGTIDPVLLPRIFDPFMAGERGHDRASGLGLGLYIVNQIVRRHGGTVAARSNDSEGVVFLVDLPRAGAPDALG